MRVVVEPVEKVELFHPRGKYAILVNGRNMQTGYAEVPAGESWDPYIKQNDSIYHWEMLLTGSVDFGNRCPINRLPLVRMQRDGISTLVQPAELVVAHPMLEKYIAKYANGEWTHSDFSQVAKVFCGESEVETGLRKSIEHFAGIAGEESLTMLLVHSHGDPGSIEIGSTHVEYGALLKELDAIKGKKVLFVNACYSGSLINVLDQHERRDDYSVFTGGMSGQRTTNHGDLELDDQWHRQIGEGTLLSELSLESPQRTTHIQQPLRRLRFDTRLM